VRDLAAALKQYAHTELGFDLVGIAPAEPLPELGHLLAWVAAGAHGEMSWLAVRPDSRADPGRFLPGARSVVSVAVSYHDPPDLPALSGTGTVARYARRRDYHRPIAQRLRRLGRWLVEHAPGTRWRPAVDRAPLLEKALAYRAGLGWIGKHTCLVNARLGSELLLGELVTTASLPADEPAADGCGGCSACVEACPGRAIRADRFLDARRCISYLTVEHGAAIAGELAGAVGNRLFGCDRCQEVCPFNHGPANRAVAWLAPRDGLSHIPLRELDGLADDTWRRRVAGTPLGRLHGPRLRRNLLVLLENASRLRGA
jgi:epoxyqueuosine reductase